MSRTAIPRLVAALVACAMNPIPVLAQDASYKELYEQANQSAMMWKERAAILDKENQSLRDQVARLRGQPPVPVAAGVRPAVAATPAVAAAPKVTRSEVEIPIYGAVNLQSYGGPSIKVNIWATSPTGAIVQVGNEARRQLDYAADGRVLLHRDASGDYEVHLLNSITSPNTVRIEILQTRR
jgi:hypothetical protein